MQSFCRIPNIILIFPRPGSVDIELQVGDDFNLDDTTATIELQGT